MLLTRVCLSYNLHLTIPISNVDENMKRASKRDAVREQKFFFRTNLGKLHGACFTSLSFIYFVGLNIFENKFCYLLLQKKVSNKNPVARKYWFLFNMSILSLISTNQ